MSGLTGLHTVADPQRGRLHGRGGVRRGRSVLAGRDDLPLALPRGRSGPEAGALAPACALPARFESLQPAIAAALHEHVGPCDEAAADADPGRQVGALGARTRPLHAGVVTLGAGTVIEP